jgi:hypothetical protein
MVWDDFGGLKSGIKGYKRHFGRHDLDMKKINISTMGIYKEKYSIRL